MRSVSFALAATVTAGLCLIGCTQGTSPMHPTFASSTPARPRADASQSTEVVSIPAAFTIRPSGKASIQACVGEAVIFSGTARLVAHQTTSPDGSTELDLIHFNSQGAVATGESSGVTYRLAGADTNSIVFAPGTLTATFDANLLAIGPGTAKSFLGHVLQHITIAPDGSITALIEIVSVDCQ